MIVGSLIAWITSSVAIARIYLKKRLVTNEVLDMRDFGSDENVQVSQAEVIDKEANTNRCVNKSLSATGHTIRSMHEKAKFDEKMIDNDANFIHRSCIDSLRDTLESSLDKVYQQLQEIKEKNASQSGQNSEHYKRTEERCKETEKIIEKKDKEMKEEIKLQHRETRRRLDKLEKKTSAGYFH